LGPAFHLNSRARIGFESRRVNKPLQVGVFLSAGCKRRIENGRIKVVIKVRMGRKRVTHAIKQA